MGWVLSLWLYWLSPVAMPILPETQRAGRSDRLQRTSVAQPVFLALDSWLPTDLMSRGQCLVIWALLGLHDSKDCSMSWLDHHEGEKALELTHTEQHASEFVRVSSSVDPYSATCLLGGVGIGYILRVMSSVRSQCPAAPHLGATSTLLDLHQRHVW